MFSVFCAMCETSQLISEALVEVLILNLFLCIVRSHLQKAYVLIDVLVDVIDVKEEHERAENCSLWHPGSDWYWIRHFPITHQEQLSDF